MGWTPTLIGLAVSVALAAWARYGANRPLIPGRVRHIPWHAILFLAIVMALVFLAHLATLAGLQRPN